MSSKFNIDFIKKFPIAAVISFILVIGSLAILVNKGLNYGVDFRGGAEIQIKLEKTTTIADIRNVLEAKGFQVSSVQAIGDAGDNEFLVKVPGSEEDINKVTDSITSTLNQAFNDRNLDIRKTDIVGPKAGEQLRISGFQAMVWALLAIMIYIALRFDYKYAPGAIVALFHDVVIILGIFALVDKEFSLQIVGALLAVIGYSVNDTVVIYDRVRECDEQVPGPIALSINKALNDTLTRTFLTSATTLMVSLTMFLMGGGVIHDFFFAITLGVLIGTYSSLFVAAPTTMFFEKFQNRKA
jgi:preprotein translocase subunit SecF